MYKFGFFCSSLEEAPPRLQRQVRLWGVQPGVSLALRLLPRLEANWAPKHKLVKSQLLGLSRNIYYYYYYESFQKYHSQQQHEYRHEKPWRSRGQLQHEI